jgi:hypothetical protein
MSEKQYHQREIKSLTDQVVDLKKTLEINKQLMDNLMRSTLHDNP